MHDVTVQAPEQTQVGVITFSYDAKREFDMNTYSTKDEVLQAVESIHYKVRDCAMRTYKRPCKSFELSTCMSWSCVIPTVRVHVITTSKTNLFA